MTNVRPSYVIVDYCHYLKIGVLTLEFFPAIIVRVKIKCSKWLIEFYTLSKSSTVSMKWGFSIHLLVFL